MKIYSPKFRDSVSKTSATPGRASRHFYRFLIALVLLGPYFHICLGQTYTVNVSGDQPDSDLTDKACDIQGTTGPNPIPYSNECTLRAAIQQAMATGGDIVINTNSPIQVMTPLPPITRSIKITGNVTGLATIQFAGAGGSGDALALSGGRSTIKGLRIIGFNGAAVHISGPGFNEIFGDELGLDASCANTGNMFGIVITDSSDNFIGNGQPNHGNVVSCNLSYGIWVQGASARNKILGNFIGTDRAGTLPLGNSSRGIELDAARDTEIGGTSAAETNLIEGNYGGVYITGGGGTKLFGNLLGVSPAGAIRLGNAQFGVWIHESSNNFIGAPAPILSTTTGRASTATTVGRAARPNSGKAPGNIISNSGGSGLLLDGSTSTNNLIQGNVIGLDASGLANQGNAADGITLNDASNNLIGGETSGSGNQISCNGITGLRIHGATAVGNKVQGNWIGVDSTGTQGRSNAQVGLYIDGAKETRVGDVVDAGRNLISANGQVQAYSGIRIQGTTATGNRIQGNTIGLDLDGQQPLGNSGNGVTIDGGSDNYVGGINSPSSNYLPRNLISGNQGRGVWITGGGARNHVLGNYIGPDAGIPRPGPPLAATQWTGVALEASGNFIGDDDPGGRNIISNNAGQGITISGQTAAGNSVRDNFIGVDRTGANALPNSGNGVEIDNAPRNVIGGYLVTAGQSPGNVISGNKDLSTRGAVHIEGTTSTDNQLLGNMIGTASDGKTPLPNGSFGVWITGGASNNKVGPSLSVANPKDEDGNIIAFNEDEGVVVDNGTGGGNGTGNLIRWNLIFSNKNLGIDLGNDGVSPTIRRTQSAPFATIQGPNNWQRAPILNLTSGGQLGTLDSDPAKDFEIEFFSSPAGDVSGYGQAKKRLGIHKATTDKDGFTSFVVPQAPSGEVVSAVAIDPDGNTSEFSKLPCEANLLPDNNLTLTAQWVSPGAKFTAVTAAGTATIPIRYDTPNVYLDVQLTGKNLNPLQDDLSKAFVVVTARNTFTTAQANQGQVFGEEQPLDKSGKARIAIPVARLLKEIAAGENKNLLEASVTACYRGKTQTESTGNLVNVLREKLIVFLPGVLGSEITVKNNIFPSFPPIFPVPLFNGSLADLKMNPVTATGASTPVNPATGLSLFSSYWGFTVYDVATPLAAAVKAQLPGLTLTPTSGPGAPFNLSYYYLEPWPYDWRLKLEEDVAALAQTPIGTTGGITSKPLGELLTTTYPKTKYPFLSDKVALVGHSTGGLIVRSALTKTPPGLAPGQDFKQWVDRAFFINVPFLGAPKAYYTFMTGEMVSGLLNTSIMQQLAPDMPIVAYLSPVAGYIDTYGSQGDLLAEYGPATSRTVFNRPASMTAQKLAPYMRGAVAAAQSSPPTPPPGPWNLRLAEAADAFFANIGRTAPVIGWENTVVFAASQKAIQTPGELNINATTPPTVSSYPTSGDGTVPSSSLEGGVPLVTPNGYQPRSVAGIPKYIVQKDYDIPASSGAISLIGPVLTAGASPLTANLQDEELEHSKAANLQPVWDRIVDELSTPEEADFSKTPAKATSPTLTGTTGSSQSIGEAETLAMATSLLKYSVILDPTQPHAYKQGFDGLFCDGSLNPIVTKTSIYAPPLNLRCDGTLVVAEAKGGYYGDNLEDVLGLGYDYRQGTLEWARKASECLLDPSCYQRFSMGAAPDADQEFAAQAFLDALASGSPVRVEVFHADFVAGTTTQYFSATYPY